MPSDEELAKVVKDYLQKRSQATDQEFLLATERSDLKIISGLKFEAHRRQFAFYVDEPPERGGTDAGPSPLAYFVAGAASCLLNQYSMLAIGRDIHIRGTLSAKANFDRRLGGSFESVEYDIKLESTASAEEIASISKEALGMCYANNTLRRAGVSITANVFLNGKPVSKNAGKGR